MKKGNPFKITTPEDLTAEETVKLFVDVFSDFKQITDPGHIIIKGPRGTGKSMMLRFLEPDCQCLDKRTTISSLPFIAIYIPLKNTNFRLAELQRFENKHAATLINEHLMITHCLIKAFSSIGKLIDDSIVDLKDANQFYTSAVEILSLTSILSAENDSVPVVFETIIGQLKKLYREIMNYINLSSFSTKIEPYSGPLFDYNDYCVPLLTELSKLISNNNTTIYLLLDDAHFLSLTQTKILNTWVSSRSSRKVSLKISTQYNYKTYYTMNGATIDTPHDYTELDIATVYTEDSSTSKNTYYRRIEDIVKKRLKMFDISVGAKEFFPCDVEQEEKIKEIEKDYIHKFEKGDNRGTNRTDDARRYARPDYIKSLGGVSKSSSTYSYSGFGQLVNISSGVVRYFLQQAHLMYARQEALLEGEKEVLFINPSIQNEVVRESANKALFDELEAYTQEGHEESYPKEDIQRLSNLIQGLGVLFRKKLLSDQSERRVFSIAISDQISDEVNRILNIGLQLGYFHKSTIGRKNAGSIGRLRLYVLNRRLAPIWNLDPNGFAGYLFLKNQVLEDAIKNPMSTARYFDQNNSSSNSSNQISLFDSETHAEEE